MEKTERLRILERLLPALDTAMEDVQSGGVVLGRDRVLYSIPGRLIVVGEKT